MGTFSDAAKNAMLDNALKGTASPLAGQVWAKLHIGDPGSAGTGNPAANTTRKQCTVDAAAAGSSNVSSETRWNNVPNAETYSWVSFWDASSGGNFLGKDDLPTPKTVAVGDNFFIAVGDIDFSL